MLDLNNPLTRQNALREKLDQGVPLVAATLASELGISIDTVRRDLIALEQQGMVRRVRGGALPVTTPLPSYSVRAEHPDPVLGQLADKAAGLLPERGTVFLDAGTTMNAVAARIPRTFKGLIVTPAPSVALAALNAGAQVHLIGGPLCCEGVMATGGQAEKDVNAIAADLAILGACGMWPDFGLSAEDAGEAGVKRAMAMAARRVAVVTSATKLEKSGRHRVLRLEEIDTLVTNAPSAAVTRFEDAGIEVVHV